MRAIHLFLCSFLALSGAQCGSDNGSIGSLTTPFCPTLSPSHPINEAQISKGNSVGLENNFYLYYDPLILPFTIRYSPGKGISIVAKDVADAYMVTPIGVVGARYSVNTKNTHDINGIPVNGGDFVVGLVDKKKDEKHLYKIEGYSRLKVVSNGRTTIDAQNGYVEIDVTDATVQELSFVDNSKISLVNTTDKKVKFWFGIQDATTVISWGTCEIEPHSYRNYPYFSIQKEINDLTSSKFYFKVENNDKDNDQSAIVQCKVAMGDVCQILGSGNENMVTLQKKQ